MNTDPRCDAARLFMARYTGRQEPGGAMDEWGIWHPDPAELRECCVRLLKYLPDQPMALYRHCKTFKHVAKLTGVSRHQLQKVARQFGYPKGAR